MDTPFELLEHVVTVLEALGLPYAVGGSVASMAYGEPRSTRDLDLVVALTEEDVPALAVRFPPPDFYLDTDTAREAVRERSQFNIIHGASGLKIDVYVAGDRLSRQQIERARRLQTAGGYFANFSSPEELIVKKLEYYGWGGSEKHLRDVAEMLRISGTEIDRARVAELAAEYRLGHVWEAVLKRVGEV
ncbi:MAG TPA: hypothetical protein VFX98_14205 [Longimicrobiaceae bacterium]|nr:hypothetical protein [Longimicrobiaceae bacterium]